MAKKASVRDVRRTNRALLVRHLLLAGETSRSAIGEDTGLSPATVTSVMAELLDENTVREEGFLDSLAGGRRRVIVGLNPAAALLFGADVGETQVTTSVFDLTLGRLGTRVSSFAGRHIEPEQVEAVVQEHVDALLTDLGADRDSVLGLGLGVPGIVENPAADDIADSVVHAEVIGWHEAGFGGLEERLGFPVYVDNGAKTTTQAEAWYGSAKDIEHAVVVLIGDGAGAGIITNGRLYRGSSSSAGEWGHTKISLDGAACRCGSRGCVETFVGASAVLGRWSGRDGDWTGRETEGIAALLAAADEGDARAMTALHDLVSHLGLALSNLVNLYNPQKIIIGGWFGDQIAGRYLEDISSAVRRFSLEQPGSEAVVERSRLGQEAVALGAATLPLDRFIEMGWPQKTLGSPKHQ